MKFFSFSVSGGVFCMIKHITARSKRGESA
jgi:hypothetical protein